MAALAEHSNVFSTALNLLHGKGYRVWYEEEQALFWAEKDGWDFASDSPCGLLGLVSIFEHLQPHAHCEYWWKIDGEFDCMTLPREPPDYQPVYRP